jgi:hypothetical protein
MTPTAFDMIAITIIQKPSASILPIAVTHSVLFVIRLSFAPMTKSATKGNVVLDTVKDSANRMTRVQTAIAIFVTRKRNNCIQQMQ